MNKNCRYKIKCENGSIYVNDCNELADILGVDRAKFYNTQRVYGMQRAYDYFTRGGND